MNKIITFFETLIYAMTLNIFGVRAQGEKLPQPTFRTVYPDDQPSEFEWNQMFRVSSLCGVDQRVCLDGPRAYIPSQPVKKTFLERLDKLF
jgi:hypothetical protein